MGMIYRRMIEDGRRVDPGDPDQKRRLPCEDEKHGQTEKCPTCRSRFGATWWVKFYRAGKPFFESSKSGKIGVAKQLLQKREGQIIEGTFTGVKADRISFEQLAEAYLNDYRVNKKRSLDKAETSVEHLKTRFAGRRAVEITTPEIRAYIAQRQADQMANGTINRELAALRRMFCLAMQDGILHHRPHVPSLAEDNVRTGFFGDVEFLALREALPAYLKPVALFAYTFGWRKAEILGLTWDRVDLAAGTVRLDPGTTKNREGRTVSLTADLRAVVLEEWKQACLIVKAKQPEASPRDIAAAVPWVFHRKGKRIGDYRKAWATACMKAGLSGRRLHDFRRTAVRNMTRAGVPDLVAMRVSGHKTRSIFDRYNIVSEQDLQDVARKLEAAQSCNHFVTAPVKSGAIPANSSQDTVTAREEGSV